MSLINKQQLLNDMCTLRETFVGTQLQINCHNRIMDDVFELVHDAQEYNPWHDLRANPQDLPRQCGLYLVQYSNKVYQVSLFDDRCRWGNEKVDVMRWKDIE